MITRCLIAAGVSLVIGANAAVAQTCGGIYTIKGGDSLSLIADSLYKDAKKWTAIHQGNVSAIGSNPNSIRVGQKIRLTCINGLPTGLEGGTVQTASTSANPAVQTSSTASAAVQVAAANRKLKLLTADDNAPFTDSSLPGGGLLTEVVNSALKSNSDIKDFGIYVVNDWSAHLDPLITDAVFDLGFPWYKPDCKLQPDTFRCAELKFSEPMFEILMMLYQPKDRQFAFNTDTDMHGKSLCRPKGWLTYDLDGAGRNWLANNLVELKQADTVGDCFEMMLAGDVDSVSMDEFVGRAAIKDLNIGDKVHTVDSKPISIQGMHVVVGKEHPQGDEMLALIDKGLANLKASGDYQRILDTHMSRIWAD